MSVLITTGLHSTRVLFAPTEGTQCKLVALCTYRVCVYKLVGLVITNMMCVIQLHMIRGARGTTDYYNYAL